MCIFDWYMYQPFQPDPIFTSLISGLLGSAIGGFATYKAVDKAHEHNIELEKLKEAEEERNVILSIIEELKVLKETYQVEMDNIYNNLPQNEYILNTYTITQDFMTIYTHNSNKIGIIKDDKIRNLIIKSYTYLKKYIEYLLNYKDELNYFERARDEFIARAYPHLINTACSRANTTYEISNIKEMVNHNNWSWLNSQFLNPAQVQNFLNSDEKLKQDLIDASVDLKEKYIELKNLIDEVVNIGTNKYNE